MPGLTGLRGRSAPLRGHRRDGVQNGNSTLYPAAVGDRMFRYARVRSLPMSDANGFYESWPRRMNDAKAMAPEVGRAFGPFFRELMKAGALAAKDKELIALGIGIAQRCEACIYTHVEKCLKAGASEAEVMETAGVAVMMGGGPVYTYLAVVAEAVRSCAQRSVEAA